MKQLCKKCLLAETCLSIAIYEVVPDEVTKNPQLVRVVRTLAYKQSISYSSWPHYAVDLAHKAKRPLMNRKHKTVNPKLEVFLPTDWEIDAGFADDDKFYHRMEEWFRHVCCIPLPDHVTPYVTEVGMARFCVLANLLLAAFPEETANWPRRGIAANDNAKPPCQAANDNDLIR